MAKITVSGNVSIDMRELADDSGGVVTDGYFYDNAYETYNGITYEDVIEVSYSTSDGYGYAYFGGKGIGESGGSLTGTITGFLDEYYSDRYGYQGFYTIEGISIGMSDLEEAVSSGDDADYIALIMDELAGNDTFTLGQNADYVNAGAGSDRVSGNGGNDTLIGSSGNDTINGGSGSDSMAGGTGNDIYVVNTSSDRINETSTVTTEIDTVQSSVSWTLGANLDRLTLTGTAAVNGVGNTLANLLTGNSAANSLSGGSGNDTLSGGTGHDKLDGGTGNDSLTGGAGNDTYVVNATGDRISETTTTSTEIDTVQSSLTWTLGANLERLTLIGSATIDGAGNSLSNVLTGNAAGNLLNGGSGNDTLSGGVGNDRLYGGAGNDALNGGAGQDFFRFTTALSKTLNVDRIADFVSVDDRLDLDNAVFTALGPTGALSSSAFRSGSAAADSNDRIIYNEPTGQLLYDADGNGSGASMLFATVTAGTDVTAADIFVI